MIKSVLYIAVGGGIGSVCRYLLQLGINRLAPMTFPRRDLNGQYYRLLWHWFIIWTDQPAAGF